MELIRRKGGGNYKPRARREKLRFDFRHEQLLSMLTLAKKSTETAGRRPRYEGASTKKAVFLLEETKKRHLRAGDGAMLCECFANGLKISPRCDGGLAHRWRAP